MEQVRVLIIDDSVTIRAILEQMLSSDRGCRVVGIASDVQHARELLEDSFPNVITLDLAMPGIDGLQFLDELANRRHAPVVVVSSRTKEGSEASAEAIAHGAYACFDKAKLVSEAALFMRTLKKAAHAKPVDAKIAGPALVGADPAEQPTAQPSPPS